jgi:hypothetical protein
VPKLQSEEAFLLNAPIARESRCTNRQDRHFRVEAASERIRTLGGPFFILASISIKQENRQHCHSRRFCEVSERRRLEIMFLVMGPLATFEDRGSAKATSEEGFMHTAADQEECGLYSQFQR